MGAIARGPSGSSSTITVGTVTTLESGSTATVSNSGTSSAATLNFGIPRGADAGIKWDYDSSTSMADPGSGEIRFNNATLSSVTAIAVSATGSGSDVSDFVAAWDNSTSSTPAYIMIREEAGAVAAVFSLSAVADNTDWLQLTVAYVSGSLALAPGDPLFVTPLLVGNKGADGAGAGDVTAASSFGTDNLVIRSDGTGKGVQSSVINLDDTTGTMYPTSNDSGALGKAAQSWSDLFLASGGVVNWNNGDVLITHSSNTLALSGASSGYTFDAAPLPASDDGAAIGSSANKWSDLFLASGAVINFNSGDVTVTHSANTLALAGASSGYTFDAAPLPATTDGAALGSASLMWSDLFLASGAVVNFNNGDVTITHSSNTLAFAGASSGYSFDAPVAVTGGAFKETVVALSDGATPALDASLGNVFTLAAAGNRTIAVPTNPVSGQKIIIRHLASGGARTLALNTGAGGFRFGTDVTALTETASGKYDYIGCIYNAVDSKWDVVAYSKGYG